MKLNVVIIILPLWNRSLTSSEPGRHIRTRVQQNAQGETKLSHNAQVRSRTHNASTENFSNQISWNIFAVQASGFRRVHKRVCACSRARSRHMWHSQVVLDFQNLEISLSSPTQAQGISVQDESCGRSLINVRRRQCPIMQQQSCKRIFLWSQGSPCTAILLARSMESTWTSFRLYSMI